MREKTVVACSVVNPSPTGLMVNQRVSSLLILSERENCVVACSVVNPSPTGLMVNQ